MLNKQLHQRPNKTVINKLECINATIQNDSFMYKAFTRNMQYIENNNINFEKQDFKWENYVSEVERHFNVSICRQTSK